MIALGNRKLLEEKGQVGNGERDAESREGEF